MERYFLALKMLDYNKANTIALEIKNESVKVQTLDLLKIVAQRTSDVESNYLESNTPENKTKYNLILTHLIEGYKEFYSDEYSSIKAYQSFSDALSLSYDTENVELVKFCLISILNILRTEIFIGSKQFNIYLNHFKEIANSKDDQLLIAFYNVTFSSKEDENLSVSLNYEQAMDALDRLFFNLPKSYPYMSYYLFEKGIQAKLDGSYNNAVAYFENGLELCDKPHLNSLANVLAWQLSHTYLKKKDYEKSAYYLGISKESSRGLKKKFYNERLSAWYFQELNVFDSAYYHLNRSIELEYKMGAKNNSLETALLSVQNQTDKLKLDKLELAASNTKNRNLTILLAVLLALGSVIGVLINKNSRRKQLLAEQEQTLQKQKVTSLLKEQELITIDAMVQGQEKERQRVANELHDDLGSLMAAVKLQFNSLEASDKKGNLETFAKTESLINEAYGKIRAIAHAKNSGLIAKQGLLQAVKQMAEKVSVASNIHISVHDHGLDNRLENSLELTLFRIVQELMANTIKHAEATEMSIHITNHGDSLNIMAEDNGRGMVLGSGRTAHEGMGLKSIDKRITHLNGTMNMESEMGKGTVIILDIPI
ncbi:sensor histidine kinase [Maribacter hydrothermalis]|nr:ATP-binding protein [Maribacter hydrothermalis]